MPLIQQDGELYFHTEWTDNRWRERITHFKIDGELNTSLYAEYYSGYVTYANGKLINATERGQNVMNWSISEPQRIKMYRGGGDCFVLMWGPNNSWFRYQSICSMDGHEITDYIPETQLQFWTDSKTVKRLADGCLVITRLKNMKRTIVPRPEYDSIDCYGQEAVCDQQKIGEYTVIRNSSIHIKLGEEVWTVRNTKCNDITDIQFDDAGQLILTCNGGKTYVCGYMGMEGPGIFSNRTMKSARAV